MEMVSEARKPTVKILGGIGNLLTLEIDTKRISYPAKMEIYSPIRFLMLTVDDLLDIGNQIKVLAIQQLKANKAKEVEQNGNSRSTDSRPWPDA